MKDDFLWRRTLYHLRMFWWSLKIWFRYDVLGRNE